MGDNVSYYLTRTANERCERYKVRIRDKADAPKWGLCWLYGKALRWVKFLRWDERVTTIGRTVWVTPAFRNAVPYYQAITLEHEIHHVHQCRTWWAWYWLSYVLVLPAGMSMRGVWEAAAFLRGFRVRYSLNHPSAGQIALDASCLTETLCGKSYLYALWAVRPLVKWAVARKLRRIADGK